MAIRTYIWIIILFFCIFRATHMAYEVPSLGAKSKLQLLAYTTATEMQDLSLICDLHHSSWQWCSLNPLSRARDWTHILIDSSWVHYHWDTMGTPIIILSVNRLNGPIKRQSGWMENNSCIYAIYKINTSDLKMHNDSKWRIGKR